MKRWIAATLAAMVLGGAVLDAHKGDKKHKGKKAKDGDAKLAVAVDARERTFHGGNVSFRTSALRQSAASGPPADTRMDATGSVRSMRPSASWRARAGGQRTRRKPAPCG